jgi:hypothetical protein
LKALKYKYDEKEKDLSKIGYYQEFLQYDKNNLLEELNSIKKAYDQQPNIDSSFNRVKVEEGVKIN